MWVLWDLRLGQEKVGLLEGSCYCRSGGSSADTDLTLTCEHNCAVESWRSFLSLDLSLFIWKLDAGAAILGSKAGSAGSAKS